jgi:hypothetical protein
MKLRTFNAVLATASTAAVVGILTSQVTAAPSQSDWRSATQSAPAATLAEKMNSGYAEFVYRKFTEYSDGQVKFSVNPIAMGRMTELKDIRLSDVTGTPKVRFEEAFEGEANRTAIVAPRFSRWTENETKNPDDEQTGQGLDAAGLPMAEGRYRVLSVRATIGGAATSYNALEMCWKSKQWCFVYDPVFDATSRVSSIARFRAEDAASKAVTDVTAQALLPTCVFSKNKSQSVKEVTQNGFSKSAIDVLNNNRKVGTINVGDAYIYARCAATASKTCYATKTNVYGTPKDNYADYSGYRNMSSGYKAACHRVTKFSTSGAKFGVLARTGCTFNWNNASLKYSVSGTGSSLNSSAAIRGIELIETNVRYTDTCVIK